VQIVGYINTKKLAIVEYTLYKKKSCTTDMILKKLPLYTA